MDDEIERLVIGVRADTSGFARDVAAMRDTLTGPFAAGAERAGRVLEGALLRAVRTGKLSFEDLKSVALAALAEIAMAAVRAGIGGGGGRGGGGLLDLIGLPGRATGGPVSPGRAYRVGERGPEVFVPTSSGQVVASGGGGAGGVGGREVRVSITLNAPAGVAPAALAQSGRQVARAVRAALTEAG